MYIYPNVCLVFLLELKFRTVMPEPTKSALAQKDFRGHQCAGQQGVPPAQPQGELLTSTRC